MKSFLPYLFAGAWAPIVWLFLSAAVEPALYALSGSHMLAQVVIVVCVVMVVSIMFRGFSTLSRKIFKESD